MLTKQLTLLVNISFLLVAGSAVAGHLTLDTYERGRFEGARVVALSKIEPEGRRAAAARDMVLYDASRARGELLKVFLDSSGNLKNAVAEELARFGDDRAFQYELERMKDPNNQGLRHQAARILGNSGDVKYCPPLATLAEDVLRRNRGKLRIPSAEDLADLGYAVLSLARLGDEVYRPVIFDAASTRMSESLQIVDALGFVDTPRSRELLRRYADAQYQMVACEGGGEYIHALLALSRLNDEWAIGRFKAILRGEDPQAESGHRWQAADRALCGTRETAFRVLRHRDSGNFGEVLVEIATQSVEGPWTKQAWMALGLSHPDGFGKRLFDLALSKKQWKYVTTPRLYKAIMACDPSLNDEFWRSLGAKEIQSGSAERSLVENGLGYLMFEGTAWWEGE